MDGGFIVGTGRFQGDCSGVMSLCQAILLASRWAMPSCPAIAVITKNNVETRIKTWTNGKEIVSRKDLTQC